MIESAWIFINQTRCVRLHGIRGFSCYSWAKTISSKLDHKKTTASKHAHRRSGFNDSMGKQKPVRPPQRMLPLAAAADPPRGRVFKGRPHSPKKESDEYTLSLSVKWRVM